MSNNETRIGRHDYEIGEPRDITAELTPDTARISLTKYQRDEIEHLHDIAVGEANDLHEGPNHRRAWGEMRDALAALLDGEPTAEQRALLAGEIGWRRSTTMALFGDEVFGHSTSMASLLRKLA